MQLDLKKFKVKRPKPKFQLTEKIIELTQKYIPLQKKIFFEFNKRYSKTPYANPKKIMEMLKDENPNLFKTVNALGLELEKEKFKEAYGEDLTSVEMKAFTGDRSSWLKLLKWDITYLEDKRLREMIYEESNKKDSLFLEEVGKIISKPKRFHASVRRENYTQFILTYDPEKSIDKNLNMLTYLEGLCSSELIEESDVVTPDRRQIMRVFKKRKKK